MEDGILRATLLYRPGGEETIRTAMKILRKQAYAKENTLSTMVIDSTNVLTMKLQTEKLAGQEPAASLRFACATGALVATHLGATPAFSEAEVHALTSPRPLSLREGSLTPQLVPVAVAELLLYFSFPQSTSIHPQTPAPPWLPSLKERGRG